MLITILRYTTYLSTWKFCVVAPRACSRLLKLLQFTMHYFSSPTKNIDVHVCVMDAGIQTDDCCVMRHRSSNRQRSTNNSVTVTVTARLDERSGQLYMKRRLPEGQYEVRVKVHDVVWKVEVVSTVTVVVKHIDDVAISSVASLRIQGD